MSKRLTQEVGLQLVRTINYGISIPAMVRSKNPKKNKEFSKMAKKSNLKKKSQKIRFRQNVRHLVKFQYFEL